MTDDTDKYFHVDRIQVNPGGKAVIAHTIIGDVHIESSLSSRDRRNRLAMLKRVRHDWIEGILKQSLFKTAPLDLTLEPKADAVELPLNALVQLPDHDPLVIREGTPIIDVFEALSGSLLILGAPGTGKTTLLLQLADALIDRAYEDENIPIPVVFSLSTWAIKREPLESWLVAELNQRWGVSKRVSKRWVDTDQILPLLDGLDEVDFRYRTSCANEINRFRDNHGLFPLAVCSRLSDFEELQTKLKLNGAVVVQPLTRVQLETYLGRSSALRPISTVITDDPVLAEMLETPLMLWVAVQAYKDAPPLIRPGDSVEEKRQRLFQTFVSGMFRRTSLKIQYTEETTLRWVRWLAGTLLRQKQTVFYLENLQPNWLPNFNGQLAEILTLVVCAVPCGIIFGLFFAIYGFLNHWLVRGAHWRWVLDDGPGERISGLAQ